ncbi:MAG: hypothetical protein KJS73_09905 [Gammaproteobacteria bacterium]|jgi:hypothetical protein|nr:hypothetical protein [Gammaproteobacteria bacterium]
MLVSLAVETSAQRYARAALLACLIGLPACSIMPSSTQTNDRVEAPADPAPPAAALEPTEAPSKNAAPAQTGSAASASALPAPAPAPAFKPVARVQRIAPFRHVSEFMTAADWQNLKADTVGLKICALAEAAETTVEVADPSPLSMLNEAAIAWGKASSWEVVNAEGATFPICTFVIARFGR